MIVGRLMARFRAGSRQNTWQNLSRILGRFIVELSAESWQDPWQNLGRSLVRVPARFSAESRGDPCPCQYCRDSAKNLANILPRNYSRFYQELCRDFSKNPTGILPRITPGFYQDFCRNAKKNSTGILPRICQDSSKTNARILSRIMPRIRFSFESRQDSVQNSNWILQIILPGFWS